MNRTEAITELGQLLTGLEATLLADRLEAGETYSSVCQGLSPSRQVAFQGLVKTAGLRQEPDRLADVLRGIAGARSLPTKIDPLWTMPNRLAGSGALINSLRHVIDGARMSITCATYNFQESSQFWEVLRAAARRPALAVKVYVDSAAAKPRPGWPAPPTTEQLAEQLRPGAIYRTIPIGGKAVRSHAKFLAVDHRFLIVTSANFSWSAENRNIEFGVMIDNASLTESVERQLSAVEGIIYERVHALP